MGSRSASLPTTAPDDSALRDLTARLEAALATRAPAPLSPLSQSAPPPAPQPTAPPAFALARTAVQPETVTAYNTQLDARLSAAEREIARLSASSSASEATVATLATQLATTATQAARAERAAEAQAVRVPPPTAVGERASPPPLRSAHVPLAPADVAVGEQVAQLRRRAAEIAQLLERAEAGAAEKLEQLQALSNFNFNDTASVSGAEIDAAAAAAANAAAAATRSAEAAAAAAETESRLEGRLRKLERMPLASPASSDGGSELGEARLRATLEATASVSSVCVVQNHTKCTRYLAAAPPV
eukprot:SAG11_NODE_3353_length_2506_cov_1.520980_2_plen_302_part_00